MNVGELADKFFATLDAMSGLEQTSFIIFLVMTITFFLWTFYLFLSK